MQAVEKGRAGQVLLKNLTGLLDEVPTTGRLAQDSADAQSEETKIVERPVTVNMSDVVIEDVIRGLEQLLQQSRVVRRVEMEGGR
jgi:hypothetical protein